MIKPVPLSFAPQLAALHKDGFAKGWPEDDFAAHIGSPLDDVLGCFDEDVLCGFIIMRTQDDQAEILTIVVDKARRRDSLGTQLLRAGEAAATVRGADIIFLEVAKDNPVAINLYKQADYQPCGVRPRYYRRPRGRVDALLFQKHF